MQRVTGIMVAALATALLGGCALGVTRDDYLYSRSSDGLWNADYGLIDWNFPTAQNQPPAEAPIRLHPERTAIGVTWATTESWPYYRYPSSSTRAADTTAKTDERGTASAATSGSTAASTAVSANVGAGGAPPPAAGGNH